MTSAQPVVATVPLAREPRASVLAAFQLVEDARYLGAGRGRRRRRTRRIAERTVVSRRLARDLPVGSPEPPRGLPQATQNSLPSRSASVAHS